MGTPYFEAMPTDLALMILLQLLSPRDLYSTIRASAPYYRIFKAKKSLVLAATIQRAIPPENLPCALAACTASKISSLASRSSDWAWATTHASRNPEGEFSDRRRQRVAAHLSHPKTSETDNNLRELSISIPLCRLWAVVDCFVTDYASKALVKMQSFMRDHGSSSRFGSKSNPENMQPLSQSERGRLQRAFFRFEAYRKLFAGSDRHVWRGALSDETAREHRRFMRTLRPWELNELHSIYDYLVNLMEDVFDDLEEYLFTNIRKAAEADESCMGESDNIKQLDLVGLMSFEKHEKASQADLIAFLVELGLPFIHRLLRMPRPDQMAIVTSFAWSVGHPTLENVLRHSGRARLISEATKPQQKKTQGMPSPGWLWISCSAYHPNPRNDYGLRELGYAFWDSNRLDKVGLSGLTRNDLGPLPKLRNRDKDPSVEERAQGLKLTWSALCDLKPEDWEDEQRRQWLDSIDY